MARLLQRGSVRLIDRLDWFARSRAIDYILRRIGVERRASEMISGLLFWVFFLLFFTAATETLGLPVLVTWLGGVSYYLLRVFVTVLIVFAGVVAGSLARDAITAAATAAGLAYGNLLGGAVQC